MKCDAIAWFPEEHASESIGLLDAVLRPGGVAVMLQACFDESGTHGGSRVLSVAGYVGEKEQWERFADEWASVLRDAGLPAGKPFHATDFENRLGDFADWSQEKRIETQRNLFGIVRRRVRHGFSASMNVDAWDSLVIKPIRASGIPASAGAHSAYSFALVRCLCQIEKWADRYDVSDRIAYFVESGSGFGCDLNSVHATLRDGASERSRYRYQSFTIVNMSDFLPLQAADLLAYESYKYWGNLEFSDKKRPTRISFESLGEVPTTGEFFDEPSIIRIVNEMAARG
jgi:hypothetical protein